MQSASKRAWLALWTSMVLLTGCGGGEPPELPAAATVLKAELSTFDGHGVWWNPAEPGTGFFFEAQGGTAVVTFYMYEANGRAVWYGAPGAFTAGAGTKYRFSGTLLRYQGGQPAGSTVVKTPTSTEVGAVTIDFDDETAQVTLPGGRSYQAAKYYKRASSFGPPWHHSETGVYWNPTQSGRGYTIEIANGTATVGVFHYADDGQPTWHLVAMSLPNELWLEAKGDFMAYTGGQALTGPYRATAAPVAQGQLGLDFDETCQGMLRLPGIAPMQVRRFPFGSLPAGKECRQFPFIPAVTSAVVPASSYFSDVTLKLTTGSFDSLSLSVGQALPASFSFSATGNLASLNGRTVYAVVVDPHGFFSKVTAPRVTLQASPPGAYVILSGLPLRRIGRYKGELLFYACLDPACATQFTGSPFRFPYNLEVH